VEVGRKGGGGEGGREEKKGAHPVMPPGVMTVEDCRLEKKKTDLGKRERTRSNTKKKR
jgi:hypothetical protein